MDVSNTENEINKDDNTRNKSTNDTCEKSEILNETSKIFFDAVKSNSENKVKKYSNAGEKTANDDCEESELMMETIAEMNISDKSKSENKSSKYSNTENKTTKDTCMESEILNEIVAENTSDKSNAGNNKDGISRNYITNNICIESKILNKIVAEKNISDKSNAGKNKDGNLRHYSTNNSCNESEILNKTVAEKNISDKPNAENKTSGETSMENEIKNNSEETISDGDIVIQKLSEVCDPFTLDFVNYVIRLYGIHYRGTSYLREEDIDVRGWIKVTLKNCIQNYETTGLYETFSSVAKLENRNKELTERFAGELKEKSMSCNNDFTEFIRVSALYVLTACDLKEKAEFDEALVCAFNAIAYTIITEKWWKSVICNR